LDIGSVLVYWQTKNTINYRRKNVYRKSVQQM